MDSVNAKANSNARSKSNAKAKTNPNARSKSNAKAKTNPNARSKSNAKAKTNPNARSKSNAKVRVHLRPNLNSEYSMSELVFHVKRIELEAFGKNSLKHSEYVGIVRQALNQNMLNDAKWIERVLHSSIDTPVRVEKRRWIPLPVPEGYECKPEKVDKLELNIKIYDRTPNYRVSGDTARVMLQSGPFEYECVFKLKTWQGLLTRAVGYQTYIFMLVGELGEMTKTGFKVMNPSAQIFELKNKKKA